MKLKLYLITLLTILGSFSASAQSVDTLSNRAGIPQIVNRINKLILSIDSTIIGYINIKIPSVMLSDSGKFLATDGVNSVWRNVPNPDLTPLERGLNDLSNNQVARSWSSDGGIILGKFDRGTMTLTNGSDTVRGHGTSWLTNQDSTWSLGFTYSFSSPSRQDSIMVLWDIIDDSTAILADNYDNWDGPYRWTGPTETIPINVSGNMATGYGSVAFGENAIAVDNFGIAIGSLARAGSSAVSIGNANQALGPYSLAIGGSDSKVTGWFNTSVGALNYITGSNSGAFGYQNTVPGQQSYAFGSYNSVQSHVSYVLGTYLISKNQGSVIIGTYNDTTSTAAFAVGTGQATFYPATRKNSFEVFSDGTTKQYKSPWGASYDSLYITTKGYVDTKLAQNPQYWGRSNTSIFPISPTGMDSTIFKIVYNGTARIKTGPWGTDSALIANKGYVDTRVNNIDLSPYALKADSTKSVSMNRDDTVQGEKTFGGQVAVQDTLRFSAVTSYDGQFTLKGRYIPAGVGGDLFSVTSPNGYGTTYGIRVVGSYGTTSLSSASPNLQIAGTRTSLTSGNNTDDIYLLPGAARFVRIQSSGGANPTVYSVADGSWSMSSKLTTGDTLRVGASFANSAVIAPSVISAPNGTVSAYNVRTDSLRIGVGLNMSKQPTASIVAENSVESNISIALQPKGTGAFYLGPKADGTATGGNARGANSIDLQLSRTAATQVARGSKSVVIGSGNSTRGDGSHMLGESNIGSDNIKQYAFGYGNILANHWTMAVGFSNRLEGQYNMAVGLGDTVVADAGNSIAIGNNNTIRASSQQYGGNTQYYINSAYAIGINARAMHNGAIASAGGTFGGIDGKSQGYTLFMRDTTGNSVVDTLTLDNSEGVVGLHTYGRKWAIIDSGFVWTYSALVSARSDVGDASGWKIEGAIQRVGNTTSMVGTPTITTLGATAGAATWAVNAVADDTNEALHILVTGAANKLIRWHASVTLSQVGF